MNQKDSAALAAMIDHTLLKPETTEDDLRKACEEAKQWHFASVCVMPTNIPPEKVILRDLNPSNSADIVIKSDVMKPSYRSGVETQNPNTR